MMTMEPCMFTIFPFPQLPEHRGPVDTPSFRSLGTRTRRIYHAPVQSLVTPVTTAASHIVISEYMPVANPTTTVKVPVYGGILHTVYEGVDYYALVQGRHTGKWSFPKGHLQLGETGPECALREIAEETGMDEVDHSQSIGTLFLHYGTYYLYECAGFDPLLPRDKKEIIHAKWMTLENMRDLSLNADVSQFRKQQCRLLAHAKNVA